MCIADTVSKVMRRTSSLLLVASSRVEKCVNQAISGSTSLPSVVIGELSLDSLTRTREHSCSQRQTRLAKLSTDLTN